MKDISELIKAAAAYEAGEPARINHFIKVYGYAKAIGELEELPPEAQYILECAAVLHDIGIRISLEKYGTCDAGNQQMEGPPVAEELMKSLHFCQPVMQRVCWLISRHHMYRNISAKDHQILVESDFLVNISEGNIEYKKSIRDKLFKTKTGIFLFDQLFSGMRET